MRERKELACGEDEADAIAKFVEFRGEPWNSDKFETVADALTGLVSVFHKRRQVDRTIKRAVTRESREPYANGYGKDRRPVVVSLLPRELIETRLKGTRRRYVISWDDLHAYLVRRHALALLSARQKAKADKRKAKLAARKANRRR